MSAIKGHRGSVPSAALKPHFRAALQPDGILELAVYEEIGENFWTGGGVTAQTVKQQLDANPQHNRIAVRINSPGGDAFEGMAILSLLRSQKKPVDVYVDGIAASAAAIVAMAGDTITMFSGAMLMIHDAWSMCVGDDEDMRKMADTLSRVSDSIAQVFTERTGKPKDEIRKLMDEETWMSADEALAGKFATNVVDMKNDRALALAGSFKALNKMKKVPKELFNKDKAAKTKRVDGEDLTWSDFVVATDHEDINTWHLPWHFSSVEKTKAHLRDALARFNQVEGLSADEKHEAWTKLVHLCKKYGIHVSEKDAQQFQIWLKKKNDEESDDRDDDLGGDKEESPDSAGCECECSDCMAGNCMNCTMQDCDDENCMDCPMQNGADDDAGLDDKAPAKITASANGQTINVSVNVQAGEGSRTKRAPKARANEKTAAATVEPKSEESGSNLSQFEARLKLLRS